MAKRKAVKKAKEQPKRLDITEEEFLELQIKYSERVIGTTDNEIDKLFRNQANRLKLRLEELRKKNA